MNGREGTSAAEAGKLALLERHGTQMLATARRYSSNLHDAEDAYQRAAEILLTHHPSGSDDEVCRWLRTTVKHEALAINRGHERVALAGAPERVPEPAAGQPDTHQRAERFERLRLGAQALGRLKPQEVRCLLLKAEGYSYKEICDETGWTYTKVNRCLTEGRRAFLERLAGIESGAECERLAPLLSALADGEAGAEDLAALRPHLRSCLTCRARLREYRDVPSRVAALVPPVALAAGGGGGGPVRSLLESIVGAAQDRVAALGERAHAAAELATGQKLAVVAASAAALAGGGAAGVQHLGERAGGHAPPVAEAHRVSNENAPPPATSPAALAPPSPTAAPTPAPAPTAAIKRSIPPPGPANEFAPEAAAASGSTSPRAAAAPAPAGEFSPAGGRGGRGPEFGP